MTARLYPANVDLLLQGELEEIYSIKHLLERIVIGFCIPSNATWRKHWLKGVELLSGGYLAAGEYEVYYYDVFVGVYKYNGTTLVPVYTK